MHTAAGRHSWVNGASHG